MAFTLAGAASLGVALPQPRDAGPDAIPGTVNLVRNPSAEVDLADWLDLDGAVVARDAAVGWQGAASVRVNVAAGGAAQPGVQVVTQTGLGWVNHGLLIGSLYVRGALAGLELWLVGLYADGTATAGDPVAVPADSPDEWVRPYCTYAPDADKTLDALLLVCRRTAGAAAGSFWVDAAQVEEDRGAGVTAFAVGQYGPPYHAWVGQAHLSPSVRDGMPVNTAQPGVGGRYQIKATLWRTNANNDKLEDLSDEVIAGTVTADRSRATAWTMTLRLTKAGWGRLRPWVDWVTPVLTVWDASGAARTGQLGHYVVLPSGGTHFEHASEIDVDCRSAEFLLSIQNFAGKVKVEEGTRITRFVNWVLRASAVGVRNNGNPRVRIPDLDKRFRKDYEFTRKQSHLDMVNEALDAAACQPVWASGTGILQSYRENERRYQERQPARLWVANFDPRGPRAEREVTEWARRFPTTSNELVGAVKFVPNLGRADNHFVVSTTDPRRPRVRGEHRIDAPDNPISIAYTGRRRSRHKNRRLIPDDATAKELARAIANEVGTRIDRVEISVLPDPSVDLLDEVVYLALYQVDGGKAAVGRFRVLAVEYGFTPDDGLMKLTLGFVHNVTELQNGVPLFYWDERSGSFQADDGAAIQLNLP